MGDLVNLRNIRKAKQRAARSAEAEVNRVQFGRTKAERQIAEAQKDLAERRLEGHRLTTPSAAADGHDD